MNEQDKKELPEGVVVWMDLYGIWWAKRNDILATGATRLEACQELTKMLMDIKLSERYSQDE